MTEDRADKGGGPDNIANKICKDLASLLSKSMPDLNVFVIDREPVQNLVEVLKKEPTIAAKYSDQELYDEVSELIIFDHVKSSKNQEEVLERVNTFCTELVKEKQYEAVLLLDGLPDLPIGMRIGSMEIIPPDDKTIEVLNYLQATKRERKVYPKNCSWAKVQFTAFRTSGIQDILYKILELPFGILSLMLRRDLDVRARALLPYDNCIKQLSMRSRVNHDELWKSSKAVRAIEELRSQLKN